MAKYLEPLTEKDLRIPAILSGVLCACIAVELTRRDVPLYQTLFGMSALFLTVTVYFATLMGKATRWVRHWTTEKPATVLLIPTFYMLIYLLYGLGTTAISVEGFLSVAAYTFGPTIVLLIARLAKMRIGIPEVVFLLAIWLPVDMATIQEAWPWPLGVGKNAFTIPMGVCLTILLVSGFRDAVDFNFSPPRNWRDWFFALKCLVVFIALAIAFGFVTGFITFNPRHTDFLSISGAYLATFLLVAIPEEVFFRGFLQNLLEKFLGSSSRALIVASIVFGLAHANNTPQPDWRYIFIASIAGVFYGISYKRTGSLLPAIFVHTSVDVVWISFFYK